MEDKLYKIFAFLFGFGMTGYLLYDFGHSMILFFGSMSLTENLILISLLILGAFIIGFLYKDKSNVSKPKIITDELAEKIVNNYGFSLSRPKQNVGLARPISFLSNSKDEIKTAFLNYITALKKRNMLTNEIKTNLIGAYSYIDSFIDDELHHKILELEQQRKTENLKSIGFEFINNIELTIMASIIKRMTEIEECF